MTLLSRLIQSAAALVALAGPVSAADLSTTFLSPSAYRIDANQPLRVSLAQGAAENATPVAWPRQSAGWLFARGGGIQRNLHGVETVDSEGLLVELRDARPGALVLGYDPQPRVVEIAPGDLDAWAADHTLAMPAGIRPLKPSARLRVRRVESARTVVRVGEVETETAGASYATSKTGQAVEIRPLFDPTRLRPGGELAVRAYVGGSGLGGVNIRATNVTSGSTQDVQADRSGIAAIRIDGQGVWRLEFHAATPAAEGGDVTLYSGTLSFEVTLQGVDE